LFSHGALFVVDIIPICLKAPKQKVAGHDTNNYSKKNASMLLVAESVRGDERWAGGDHE
jgi:hypothetical protein